MIKNSNYLVFVDEAGDHTIAHTYPEFPFLVLAFVIISKDEYCDRLLPKFARLKIKHFGDVSTIFHEREIRKQQNDFRILIVPKIREEFFPDINAMMSEINYHVASVVIDKRGFSGSCSDDQNSKLYETAVKQGMKLVHEFLRSQNDDNFTTLTFESRGKSEDSKLLRYFESSGEKNNFKLVLHAKSAGGLGLQFADMIARPIGVHLLHPEQSNRAWDIIEGKLCVKSPVILPK
jgi:hypothetical protein